MPPHITSCGAQCQNQTPRAQELCCVRAATARFPQAVILPRGTDGVWVLRQIVTHRFFSSNARLHWHRAQIKRAAGAMELPSEQHSLIVLLDFSTWIAKGDHQHTMRTETRAGSPHGLLLGLPSQVCPQPLLLTAASSRYGSQRHCSVCSAKSHIPTRSLLTDAWARCGFTPCFSMEPPGFAAVGSFGAHSPCQRPPHLL